MRIQVRKCPFTGKIFEEKDIDNYIHHLKAIREEKQEQRNNSRVRNTFYEWLRAEQAKVQSFSEIVPWILENQKKLMSSYNAMYCSGDIPWRGKFSKNSKLETLDMTCKFTPRASNTHCHPRNGITNWWCNDDKPLGYPGWIGGLTGTLDVLNPRGSPDWSAFFEMIDIHTGSGNGGNTFRYGMTVFASDWPGPAEELTFKKLAAGV